MLVRREPHLEIHPPSIPGGIRTERREEELVSVSNDEAPPRPTLSGSAAPPSEATIPRAKQWVRAPEDKIPGLKRWIRVPNFKDALWTP
eukprot:4682713-Pyramimonas_sp.AAC.1